MFFFLLKSSKKLKTILNFSLNSLNAIENMEHQKILNIKKKKHQKILCLLNEASGSKFVILYYCTT